MIFLFKKKQKHVGLGEGVVGVKIRIESNKKDTPKSLLHLLVKNTPVNVTITPKDAFFAILKPFSDVCNLNRSEVNKSV